MASGRPHAAARLFPLFFCALACVLLCCVAPGCARRAHAPGAAPPQANGLPRADPGYLQWLERQSMLGAAPELAAQVSGSERLWLNSSAA